MPGLINIVVTIDVARILDTVAHPSTDPENPTRIDDTSCFLIGAPTYIREGQATASLSLAVDREDSAAIGEAPEGDAPQTSEPADNDGSMVDDDLPLEDIVPGRPIRPVIRWRSFPMAQDNGQSAVIYQVVDHARPRRPGRTVARERRVEVPSPVLSGGENTSPPTFTPTTQTDYFLDTRLIGWKHRFSLRFYITSMNPEDCTLTTTGYFEWRAAFATDPVTPDQ